jgi:RNA polymerase sigma factor (sigma-70 family)
MGFESTPCGADAAVGPEPPERARAESLAQARTALAVAVLTEPGGRTACLRILEPLVHRGRLRGTALLLERPVPAWVEGHVLALHAQAGCQRRAPDPPLTHPQELTEALGRLPWSGEWLIVVVDRMLGGAMADDVRRVAARWVAERNAFIEAQVGLVRHVVNRHGWSAGVPREDLIQEAHLALCRAVERFDPDRGARFSSYAVPVIRHAMAQYIRRMGFGPGTARLVLPTISATSPLMSGPTDSAGRRRFPAPLSLDMPLDDGESLADRLADNESPGPDLAAALVLDRERLRDALRALPVEVKEIVALHWGLDGSAGRSVHAVAGHVGRTPAEVESVIREALRVLRGLVTSSSDGGRASPVRGALPIEASPRRSARRPPWSAALEASPGPRTSREGGHKTSLRAYTSVGDSAS